MNIKDLPDPNIDWNKIQYNNISDTIRPEPGYRFCRRCKELFAINSFNFCKNRNTPDGYAYICKNCMRSYQKHYRETH